MAKPGPQKIPSKTRAVYTNLSIPAYGQLKAISEARGTTLSRTVSDLIEEYLVFLEQDPRAWKEKVEEHARQVWVNLNREILGAAMMAALEAGAAGRIAGAVLAAQVDRDQARALVEEARRRSLADLRQKVVLSELRNLLQKEQPDDPQTRNEPEHQPA